MAHRRYLLSVYKLKEKAINASVEKNENINLQVITASEVAEYSRKIETALEFDVIQSIILLDQIAGVLALNKANKLHFKTPEELQLYLIPMDFIKLFLFKNVFFIDQHAQEIWETAFIRMLNLIN
jgi:LacI family transcriptional regulator